MKHYNPTITEDAYRIFNLKGEPIDEVMPYIQPTKELIHKLNISRSAAKTTTGSANVYTCPTDKDFFVTTIIFCWAADVAADTTSYLVQGYIEGVQRNLIDVRKITLTAGGYTVVQNFPIPLKIDRGTAISHTQTLGAGASAISTIVYGYTLESTKGV